MNPTADIVATVERLPTLNIQAVRLMELLNDENVTFSDIENIVRPDPSLTANILKAAGSAHFGLSRQVETVREAIALLGLRRVVDVVALAAMANVIPDRLPGYDISAQAFWRHCVAVAVISERIAGAMSTGHAGLAFTAGLLHDLGKLVVGAFLVERRTESKTWFRGRLLTSVESEQLILGIDHSDLGMLLARSWQLPEVVALVNRGHHDPLPNGNEAQDDDRTVAVVRAADALSHAFGFSAGTLGPDSWLDPSVLDFLNLSQSEATHVAWTCMDAIDGLVELQSQIMPTRRASVGAAR